MLMNLRQLFEVVGERVPLEYELNLRDYELFDTKPFITPVKAQGLFKNAAGVVTLDYTAVFSMKLTCDRCLKEFERDFLEHVEHVLVSSLEAESDGFILVEDMLLDLDELVSADVLLSLPSKMLCEEDCKGLCPQCGKNLNQGSCDCTESAGDPRFDVLSQLLT